MPSPCHVTPVQIAARPPKCTATNGRIDGRTMSSWASSAPIRRDILTRSSLFVYVVERVFGLMPNDILEFVFSFESPGPHAGIPQRRGATGSALNCSKRMILPLILLYSVCVGVTEGTSRARKSCVHSRYITEGIQAAVRLEQWGGLHWAGGAGDNGALRRHCEIGSFRSLRPLRRRSRLPRGEIVVGRQSARPHCALFASRPRCWGNSVA